MASDFSFQKDVDGMRAEECWLHFDFRGGAGSESLCLTFTQPVRIVSANNLAEVLPALEEVEQAVADGLYAAGFVAYEAAPAFDAAMQVVPDTELPLVWFGLFEEPVERGIGRKDAGYTLSGWEASVSEEQFAQDIERIRAAIGAGACYQVNHTLRLRTQFAGSDLAWYGSLREAQQPGYGAYLNIGRFRLLSVSPELFFERQGAAIRTRPMKGTMPRGRWSEEDDAQIAALQASEKERAENLMIVDLLRNDLGRLALPGSVQVDSLFAVERYPTVLQMTSSISAQIPVETTLAQIFTALFPCGSVTGAPKISAMAHIAALEPEPRRAYCGAIGVLVPGGPTVFSVAIRTVLLDTETSQAEYGVGSGITWDSTAAGEYAENRLKAEVLERQWPKFALLETLRLEDGEFGLEARHLDRLCASARYFGFPLTMQHVQAHLQSVARQFPSGSHRVRLLAGADSTLHVESQPLIPLPEQGQRAALARTPISRTNRFLFHKTTHRSLYDSRRAEHPEADEVLLWNEQSELTEFTTGNLVVEWNGQLLTPPLDCGLLPGTHRAELLANAEIAEQVLPLSKLQHMTRLWLINSVRGWVPVTLLDTTVTISSP